MNESHETIVLDEVLYAFRCTNRMPTPAVVREWCGRYPRFARAIMDEALVWVEQDTMAKLQPHPEDEEAVVETARAAALQAVKRPVAHIVPPKTLSEAITLRGTTESEVARQLGMPRSVLSRVLRGQVMGATIPPAFTTAFATLIDMAEDWITGRYAETRVAVFGDDRMKERDGNRAVSFQEAISDAADADEAQRCFWLEEA
jgi:transcriptional regulator with XRE-family HTH domain